MSHDIWFTSDTHFGHSNMLKFENGRGMDFGSIREHDETLIERWNARVKPQDKVYHLGDVTMQYNGIGEKILSALNGHKRLILGNHDKLGKGLLERHFEKIELWTGDKFKQYGFVAIHIPLRHDQMRFVFCCVHGHIHRNVVKLHGEASSHDPRYINVCVEQTDYRPVHLDEIRKITGQ